MCFCVESYDLREYAKEKSEFKVISLFITHIQTKHVAGSMHLMKYSTQVLRFRKGG